MATVDMATVAKQMFQHMFHLSYLHKIAISFRDEVLSILIILSSYISAPVPQNLEFSEVTHTSMRVTWELDPSVDSSTILHYQIFYIRNDGKGEPQTQLIKGYLHLSVFAYHSYYYGRT